MANQLPTLSEFRALRDAYQAQRRSDALQQLNERKTALRRDLGVLRRQRDNAPKHDRQIIENNMLPLSWEYQEVCGQVAIIERDLIKRIEREAA